MKNKEEEYNGLFRKEFLSYEPDPPEGAWDNIRSRIPHGSDTPESIPASGALLVSLNRKRWLYAALLAAGSLLLFTALWISFTGNHRISGTALTGQEKLLHGTAYLFHVEDTQIPRDSVRLADVKKLDSAGSFSFNRVPKGTYFVRIHVHPESPAFPEFRYGYTGDQLHWDEARLIHTDSLDSPLVINLPKMID